jgi:hypothetical protein
MMSLVLFYSILATSAHLSRAVHRASLFVIARSPKGGACPGFWQGWQSPSPPVEDQSSQGPCHSNREIASLRSQ